MEKMRKCKYFISAILLCVMISCGSPSVPTAFTQSDRQPTIYPDYIDVTVPVNIAPLSFEFDGKADEMVARYAVGDDDIVCNGQPDIDDWHALTEKAKGGAITVDVYTRNGDQWTRFKPFNINVSPDSIDPYISYRLIFPSFVSYESLTINQRCLENYDESVIYDNVLCSFEKDGQCINCHHYQQYNPQHMQFHARQNQGGTILAIDGNIKKINMRNDSILSAGVYPAWHPTLNLIVYATDKTHQSFHTTDSNRVEVFDLESDVIAYDIERNEVTNLENDKNEFEVFPAWSPDGRTLYYCSAHFEYKNPKGPNASELLEHYKDLKYNIYKKSFDPNTRQFGPREMVFQADTFKLPSTPNVQDSTSNTQPSGMSAILPRISPDGRFLLFTLGHFGYFHIWHRDADLWMMDLQTGECRPMDECNSNETESYHSWSSNGRWIIISSRRDDGVFTRPFIAHVDKDGKATKPFELPSEDPHYHREFMRSYNIPEFMKGPVTIKPQTFADVLKGDAVPVKYVQQLSK